MMAGMQRMRLLGKGLDTAFARSKWQEAFLFFNPPHGR
jgi:hypothetical protein